MNYIRITKDNIDHEHICCAMSGKQSVMKKEWMKERFDDGLVFYRSEERGKCFIEYIPAENAWVPIEADLLAAIQAAGGELPECSCADKCAVGAINTDCTVCAVNMGECQGKAPEPAPTMEPEPDPEPEQPKNSGETLLLVLAVVVIGGVAGWYFKIYRPKKQQAADAAEDYGDDYDDTPPWEDEDETESEDEA